MKVKVIGIDTENNRVSLSIRQTLDDPWNTVAERWTPGKTTEGTVTNLTDFGAFVEIEPGVEGLIHIGDLSWTRIKHPKEVLKKGQKVEVSIIDVDKDRKRISLGYKQLHDPWKNAAEKYQKDAEVPVKVVRIADFGAFVELEEGVEGLIHISQLSSQRVENPRDVLTEGQEVTARVLEGQPDRAPHPPEPPPRARGAREARPARRAAARALPAGRPAAPRRASAPPPSRRRPQETGEPPTASSRRKR